MAQYLPSPPPGTDSVSDLRDWVVRELQLIAESQVEQTSVELRPVFVEPARPTTGLIVYADGTRWDPGSGEGAYEYREDGLWHKL